MNKIMLPKITRKSLLYKSGVEYADYCLNHVEGCSHGCKYPCYAMNMKKRCGKISGYSDWTKPKLVSNAMELLDKEIPKLKKKIKVVHLCFSTDPFMYKQPEVRDMTLKIIERLNKDGIRCTVLTKGVYPIELVNQEKYGFNNEYSITLVSLNEAFRKSLEPGAAPFETRTKALERLHEKGLTTWVSMEPYPTPNLVKQDLGKILDRISFVDKIIFGRLNYNSIVTSYQGYKQFYEESADQVIEFCERRGISYHIKHGTKQVDNKATRRIFEKTTSRIEIFSPAQLRLRYV